MSDYLTLALDGLGYGPRLQQRTLYDSLVANEQIVAQAGTGVGKSIAILAAAYDRRQARRLPSLIVVPTNVLMDQYAQKDGPAFEAATGAVVRSLKGRSHYLCPSSTGYFMQLEMSPELQRRIAADPQGIIEVPAQDGEYGCPGSELCSAEDDECGYLRAREELWDADIIITNAHVYIIESSFEARRDHRDCGLGLGERLERIGIDEEDFSEEVERSAIGRCECRPRILPDFGAVFVDEAHTFENVVRDFQGVTISKVVIEKMGNLAEPMLSWLAQHRGRDNVRIFPERNLAYALNELGQWEPPPGNKVGHKHRIAAAEAANRMLRLGESGAFGDSSSVAWVEPGQYAKLVAMPVTVGGITGPMLKRRPFALVSATVPGTMAGNLGVGGTRFVDVGHPFDYASQGTLSISDLPGDYRSNQVNLEERAHQLRDRILASGGGALVLFSSYANLEKVYEEIRGDLRKAGLTVLRQERTSDKRALGEAFKADGNAVLFGTKSFATGFDAPGDALRLVGIWNLPYPGMSPLTSAIKDRSFAAYEDMMLVEVTQAIGRLIRKEDDHGQVWIGDSRAHRIMGRSDPMLGHLREFSRV